MFLLNDRKCILPSSTRHPSEECVWAWLRFVFWFCIVFSQLTLCINMVLDRVLSAGSSPPAHRRVSDGVSRRGPSWWEIKQLFVEHEQGCGYMESDWRGVMLRQF